VTRIGIMLGRLSPPEAGAVQAFPVSSWREEFARARDASLSAIEWIYDAHGEGANPLESDEGLDEMLALSEASGVAVASVCADWLMPNPLVRAGERAREERLERLEWLIGRCARLGAPRLVLPFVDESALAGPEDEDAALDALRRVLPRAEREGVRLDLETSLEPAQYRGFLARIDHELVKVNYDSGNSASLGYRPEEELAAYGERVGSVHVKDRVRGGGTVPLGSGNADLRALFLGLGQLGYDGDFVLQVARGRPGDEVAWAIENRRTVESLLGAGAPA
jgi:L-ribulose-5-phosphate 3-epimerase